MGININLTYPILTYGDDADMSADSDAIDELFNLLYESEFGMEHLAFLCDALERGKLEGHDGPGYDLEISCEMTYISDIKVSFVFRVYFWSGGAHPYTGIKLITVDCSTRELIEINDVFTHSDLIDCLSMGRFTIKEGMYQPAGWLPDDAGVRSNIIEIIVAGIDDDTTTGDRFFDAFHPVDFAMLTETEVLVKVQYDDSLYGYVILHLLVDC